jgi:hypothetical protein
MIRELAIWFPQHAQSMDAALALHLRSVGFDAATGQVARPADLPPERIQGCGGSCGPVPRPALQATGSAGSALT